MTRPAISVCIVTCNQRPFIGDCLRSVLAQEVNADVNILVGDDASDDGTSELVATLAAQYPERICHLVRRTRMGVFANIRDLMERAEGDFIANVDGDDYWLQGKLQRQLDYLLANPDCSAVYTNAITVTEGGNRIGLFNDVGDGRFDLAAMLRRGNFLNNSSALFRAAGRHAWVGVDIPQIDYRVHLWHAQHGWLGHIGETLAGYRVNTRGSMVASMNDRVRELYWEAIQSVPRERITDRDYALGIADFLRRVFSRALRTRRWNLLRGWHARVLAASPYGMLHTDALVLTSILRMAGKLALGFLKQDEAGRRKRVLYRR